MPFDVIRPVALRKESVDRNILDRWLAGLKGVALRKESVDRNPISFGSLAGPSGSLSARRAWIEMKSGLQPLTASVVALRKESVDRNFDAMQVIVIVMESLSARRAWIEMLLRPLKKNRPSGRSPQGERG